jgi:acyl-coenzyme A synthetase/AMP-(fatty) acid ligase/3-hydroxymyristoyl/3-hydroxydecanoyl-(acyl carrier protein) dehydratase
LPADRTIVTVYTSGSTGEHVACRKSAGQLLGEAQLLVTLFGMGPGTRLLATVPPYHIYGLLFGLLVPMMGGGAFVRGTPHHAETIAAEAARHGANVLCSVPAHLRGLSALSPGALRGLGRIVSSGAPLDERTASEVAALTGTPVTEVLGSSETGGIAWRTSGSGPAWRPFPNVRVRADEEGLMLVESPFVSSAPSSSPPVHRGADRIRALPDGRFELLGRADGVVKIGGSRISIAEVERLLREVPGVRDAAVINVDVDGPRQHELWAVVAAPGLTVADLRAALLRRIEPIALPRRFRFVEALPREENGKLVRARLAALFGAGQPAGELVAPPLAPLLFVSTAPAAADAPERHAAEVRVPADSPYFRGHFEGMPVLPGVVQLRELVLRPVQQRWPDLRHLRRVVGLKFKAPILPDDVVVVEIGRAAAASKVTFEIRRGSGPVSSGTLVFEPAEGGAGASPGGGRQASGRA